MLSILYWILMIVILAGLIGAAVWYYKTQIADGDGSSGLFKPRPEKRLAVVEQSNVDGRRKLVLIRRDHVEHLIMTGGPVDVVIETDIGRGAPAAVHRQNEENLIEPADYARTPPSFDKAM